MPISEIFYGPIYEHADSQVAVIPDFIANCGMARAFAFLMQARRRDLRRGDLRRRVGHHRRTRSQRCHAARRRHQGIASTAFEIALDQLV